MIDEWRDVEGYEGMYMVNTKGEVMANNRYVKIRGGKYRKIESKRIKTRPATNGYIVVTLYKNNEHHTALVHRLVAKAFIENPNNYPEVNHKDEDITNNNVENLEWCTSKYNANYGSRNKRCYESNSKYFKPVYQISKDGTILRKWINMTEACKAYNADISSMIRVCKGKQETCRGYKWQYVNKEVL